MITFNGIYRPLLLSTSITVQFVENTIKDDGDATINFNYWAKQQNLFN